jgi:hypothetical protein
LAPARKLKPGIADRALNSTGDRYAGISRRLAELQPGRQPTRRVGHFASIPGGVIWFVEASGFIRRVRP